MKIRKYIATSMPLALQQVREDLGDHAIILGSRQVGATGDEHRRPGHSQVEVTAGLEEADNQANGGTVSATVLNGAGRRGGAMPGGFELGRSPSVSPRDSLRPGVDYLPTFSHQAASANGIPNDAGADPSGPELPSKTESAVPPIMHELRKLRTAVERLEHAAPMALSMPPELKRIGERLRAVGLTDAHVHRCLQVTFEQLSPQDLDDRAAVVRCATASLSERMPGRRDIKIAKKRKVIGFVGPSGAGKTTVAAKIAAGFAVKHQERRDLGRIVLVSADGKRVAAGDQLRAYAQMIGIPFDVVSDESGVVALLDRHSEAHLILMDMAGCGPHEHTSGREQQRMLSSAGVTEVQVVLDSLTSYEHMLDVVEWSEPFPERRLLFTKIDQAVRVGGVLSAAASCDVPTSYFSVGPCLPGQIKAADLSQLVSEIICSGHAPVAQGIDARGTRGEN